MEPEVKQEKKEVQLNSFDTIKVGDKLFPSPTPFIPHYYTHTEVVNVSSSNYDHVIDVASFPVLVLMTIAYAYRSVMNNSWSKFFSELSST